MEGIKGLTYEELTKLLDERYVRQESCNDRHKEQDAKITEISIAQERIATKLDFICKIGIAILGTLVALMGTSIWNLITK